MTSPKPGFWSAMALFFVVIVALQFYGGAYTAEFDGHADEAAHFISSLLVRDYLAQWPWPSPMPWAVQYYIHYPKVAIGHWPPAYYAIQGVWWLLLPPGRVSAMVLNIGMGLVVMALFYAVARRIRDSWPVLAAGCLFLFIPIVQEAHEQVMAELPSLLFAMLLLWTLTRLLEEPGMARVAWVVLALAGALAVKGTGVVLVAAPVIGVAMSGVWRRLPLWRLIGLPLAGGLAIGGLYLWQYRGSLRQILLWGGLMSRSPWQIGQLLEVTGAGMAVLAVLGAGVALWKRQPAMLAALSIVLSVIVTSYYVRAMRETRHWIAAVPMMVLLGLAAYAWLERRTRWAPLLIVAAMTLYPYKLYRQKPAGFGALADQIRQPARMLISSPLGWSEGPWIAVASLREKRPGSTIVRATKLLAVTDWNASRYKPLVAGPEDVERKLDETAIDLVVMHNAPSTAPMPHHAMLGAALQGSPAWKRCATAGELEAYCRMQPPRFPRQPLRMPFSQRLGYDMEETP